LRDGRAVWPEAIGRNLGAAKHALAEVADKIVGADVVALPGVIALWPRRGVGNLLRTHDRHQRFYDTLAHYPPRATPNQEKHMGQLAKIDHFVVLMLENRSFDSMLGVLYDKAEDFEGLAGSETNPDAHDAPIQVWNSAGTDEATMRTPNPDPGELWTDINTQLFGSPNVGNPAPVPAMSGFLKNYLAQKNGPIGRNIMHYFTPKQVPVISTLARNFAVCDGWFASAPCQTWPNRWFVHCATADGRENNEPVHLPDVETIYNRFEQANLHDWKIYFHDLAQAHTLLKLLLLSDHFLFYRQFQADCQRGQLPTYSLIEPQYYPDLAHPENDQHPPSVVTLGEQLIADVYNCIRSSKVWKKTMLIVLEPVEPRHAAGQTVTARCRFSASYIYRAKSRPATRELHRVEQRVCSHPAATSR
jgi:phospholipase C